MMERLHKWFGGVGRGSDQNERGKSKATTTTSDVNNNFQFQGNTISNNNVNARTTNGPIPYILSLPLVPEAKKSNLPKAPSPSEAEMAHQQTVQIKLPEVDHTLYDTDAPVTESTVGQMMNSVREVVLSVVPLREGDCLSCKLIGSGTMFGAAVFVLFSYRKGKLRFTGFKRKLFALQVASLVTGLSLLGTTRFLDTGIFSPPDEHGKRKSLMEIIDEDFRDFEKMFSNVFSSASKSSILEKENKPDS